MERARNLKAPLPRRTVDSGLAASKRHSSLRVIGSFVPRLTRKVFQKHGFATAGLLTDWPIIVGPELAAYTQPERLKWPHGGIRANGSSEAPARRRGALVLRVDGARALDVHYKAALIIERINRHFGYRAVEELRIVQAPVGEPARQPRKAISGDNAGLALPEVAAVADEGLKAALYGLQAGVLERRG